MYALNVKLNGWWRLIAQVAAGAALIAVMVWQTDVERALKIAREGEYFYVLLALPLYVAACFAAAYRWRLALQHMEAAPPVGDLFGVYLAAMMLNRILPMRVGDILRVQVPSRRYGLSGEALAAIVFVAETLLDGTAFVVMFLWSLAFLGVPAVHLTIAWTLTVFTFAGLLMATLAARLELREGWEHRGPTRYLPQVLRSSAGTVVPRFLEGLELLRDVRMGAYALCLTLLNWMLQALIYYLFALTFGLQFSLAQAIVVTITAAIVVSLPLVPSSFGTYEVAVAGVLALMGLSNAESVTYALGSHILMIGFSVLAGAVAIPAIGLGLKDLPFVGRAPPREPARPA